MKAMNSKIRLVASDLDGTLLNQNGRLDKYTVAVIHQLQQKGVIFALCTGRFPENAAMVMASAGIDCPIVSFNGAVVDLGLEGPRVLDEHMHLLSARKVFDVLESYEASYHIFAPQIVVSRFESQKHHSQMDADYENYLKPRVSYYSGADAVRRILAGSVYKYYVYFKDEASMKSVRETVLTIPGVAVTQSSQINLEIISDTINKATGLEQLAKYLRIPQHQTMAIGDHLNDLPMLQWAGLSVAMDNAILQVKEQADQVTASNEKSGAALAMEKYALYQNKLGEKH